MQVIIQIGCLIAAFMIGSVAFSVVKGLASFRISSHVRYQVQNAIYYRVFELPERFFREFESADLAKRIMEFGALAGQFSDLVISVAFGFLMLLFYLGRMFSYAPRMACISLLLVVLFSGINYVLAIQQLKYQKEAVALDGKSASVLYQFLSGIEKIRIAGIEDRAVYEYLKPFVEQRRLGTKMANLSILSGTTAALGGAIVTVVLYVIAYQSATISMGQFVAFNSAYGTVSSAISGLVSALLNYKMLHPSFERIRPVLETPPETNEGKKVPKALSGQIDVDHVAFAYEKDAPEVFRDLSLHIDPGEYIGIVGSSGCGKSTLLKLLLGFECPTSGRIYYDNQDMEELDLQELRKQFGVVLQNGELISGSIYENITMTAPSASYDDVIASVEAVGLAADIEEMPMGLHTVVSENCGTISGGQKQRILIARAIISHPKIIFFDEATSALDNITQSMVCSTLEKMDATRIVIAHRLSTIRNCDRILVFQNGDCVEEGNFQELMNQNGLFHELASRQLL